MTGATRPIATWAVVLESVATALAWAGLLVWFGACLLGSFRPTGLSELYWPEAGGPRTDTSGAVAFFMLAVTLALSETLRLRRRRDAAARPPSRSPLLTPASMALTGLAGAGLVAGSGLVVYLSVNAVTHPFTLEVQATHLLPWPSEGTLRVWALGVASLSVGWLRLITVRHPGAWIGTVGGTASRALTENRETERRDGH